ncbi:MAG: metallophosphoesterase family protein [Planctomycetota bacterium]
MVRASVLALLAGALLLGCRAGDPVRVLGPEPRVQPWVGDLPRTFARDETLRLVLLGHVYGDFVNRVESPGPAASLVDGTGRIASARPDLVVLLGDAVYKFEPYFLDPTLDALSEIGAPVFDAIGNHERASDVGIYRERFGGPFGAIEIGPALVLLLQAETHPWHLGDEQSAAALELVDDALARGVSHVVVCVHKLIWALAEERWYPVLMRANAADGFDGTTDFGPFLAQLLERTRGRSDVVVCSGDVGRKGSVPLFVHRDPSTGVLFAANGLFENPRDCALLLVLEPGRPARPEIVPLAPDAPRNLSDVDLEATLAAP